jgi:hypothetical protein
LEGVEPTMEIELVIVQKPRCIDVRRRRRSMRVVADVIVILRS